MWNKAGNLLPNKVKVEKQILSHFQAADNLYGGDNYVSQEDDMVWWATSEVALTGISYFILILKNKNYNFDILICSSFFIIINHLNMFLLKFPNIFGWFSKCRTFIYTQ